MTDTVYIRIKTDKGWFVTSGRMKGEIFVKRRGRNIDYMMSRDWLEKTNGCFITKKEYFERSLKGEDKYC